VSRRYVAVVPSSSASQLSVTVLEILDNAFDPLMFRTIGMTDAEYLWEPSAGCWTVHQGVDGGWTADWQDPDPEPAPLTTIAWRCWHIAVDCLDSYSGRLFGATGSAMAGRSFVGTWAEARPLLERSWSVFRAGVAGWGEAGLFEPLGPAWGPYAEHANLDLALHAQREVVHHGAEISLLRDLYRAQRRGP
jgi:hypothetical protein